ncbi:hypothetical protein ACFVTX_04015 [Agromyces sp. NPDC058136]|uniref:hypothetical protein n=1 Tax=Agromyces sp. NPDC058136 TaxID=3346354 RepID=UPI0036D83EA6
MSTATFPHRRSPVGSGPDAEPDASAEHSLAERLLAERRALPGAAIRITTSTLMSSEDLHAADRFGAGFDVDTRGEIDRLEREGIPITGCIHIRPETPMAEITGAYLRGVRVFVIGDARELENFRELPEVAVLVRIEFDRSRRRTAGTAPRAAAAVVRACRAAGIRVAGFTVGFGCRGVVQPLRIRRAIALMRRLERAECGGFDTLDLDFASARPIAHGLRRAVHGASRRYRVSARRTA